VAGFGWAEVVPEFENSSDQMSVPEEMLGVNALVVTVLLVSPEAAAIAFTVMLDDTRKGVV
jgi:hypothetical protein